MKRKSTEQSEPADEAAAETAEPREEEPAEDELTRLARERDEFQKQWQRAQADCQNLRRRHLMEIEASRRRALQPLFERLLIVLDHLDLALGAEFTHEESRNLAQGVSMTRDELVRALEAEGVRPISTEGAFDPDLHEAVATVPAEAAEPGTIVETVRGGWKWGEHVLRHARVVVAEAQPSAAEESGEG